MKEYTCTGPCKQKKPESEYYFIQSGRRKGLRKSWCKQCLIDESRLYKRGKRAKEKAIGKELKDLSKYMHPTL